MTKDWTWTVYDVTRRENAVEGDSELRSGKVCAAADELLYIRHDFMRKRIYSIKNDSVTEHAC